MSVPLSVFFNFWKDLDDTATELQRLLGVSFQRTQESGGVTFEYMGLGVLIVLFDDHGLVDDCGIPFSRYTFEIDVEPRGMGGDNKYWRDLQISMANYIYYEITQKLGVSAMLVDNLQRLLISN